MAMTVDGNSDLEEEIKEVKNHNLCDEIQRQDIHLSIAFFFFSKDTKVKINYAIAVLIFPPRKINSR